MKDKNLITRFKMDNKNENNEEARRIEGQRNKKQNTKLARKRGKIRS